MLLCNYNAVTSSATLATVRFSKANTITMLNPKSIVILAMLNAWGYMFFAALLGRRLESQTGQRRLGIASGSVLLGAGALTLSLKRP